MPIKAAHPYEGFNKQKRKSDCSKTVEDRFFCLIFRAGD